MKRRQGEPVKPSLFVAEVSCSEGMHRVGLPVRGPAVFFEHNRRELGALRALAVLAGYAPPGCLEAVWNLPVADAPVPKEWKTLAQRARKVHESRGTDWPSGRSWPPGRRALRRRCRAELMVMKALVSCAYSILGVRVTRGISYVVHASDVAPPSISTRVDAHHGEGGKVTVTATVNLDWPRAVRDRGLSVVDGCLVLATLGCRTREFVLAGRQVAPARIVEWPAALVRRPDGRRGLRWV